jgi:hypothetical protein
LRISSLPHPPNRCLSDPAFELKSISTPSSLQRDCGADGRVQTASRVAPRVGRHQLPRGSSTKLLNLSFSSQGGWIHLSVFVHHSLLTAVYGVKKGAVATGIRNVIGNKGGVGVSMCVDGVCIAFVNAHLAAHQHNVHGRNKCVVCSCHVSMLCSAVNTQWPNNWCNLRALARPMVTCRDASASTRPLLSLWWFHQPIGCRDYHRICKEMFSLPKRRSRLSRALFTSFIKRGSVEPVLPDSTSNRELLRYDALVFMGVGLHGQLPRP